MTKARQTDSFTGHEDAIPEANLSHMNKELFSDKEVQQLARSLNLKDQIQLLEFGKEPAEQISKFSDQILNSIRASHVEDSGELLKQLGKIMEKFDRHDFERARGGFFGKLFKRGEKVIEKLFKKYQTIGGEIDKIYVEISRYKNELTEMTKMLENLYEENYQYFLTLEKYIAAGHLKLEELRKEVLPTLEERAKRGDNMAALELDTLTKAADLLEQRIHDLEMAKMVALQTAPQIRLLQRGNTKLIGKINSAFLTTIPVFKNAMVQAISAKRQKIVADSMAELDRRTNELLLRNAENISLQSREIARLAGRPGLSIETLEKTMNTILEGMEETLKIEQENKRIREEGKKKLEELQEKWKNRLKNVKENGHQDPEAE